MKQKKLKIGYFVPYFVPAWRFGGVVRGTYELGKRLAKRGHQVNIYTTDLSNDPNKRLSKHRDKIQGMNIFYFKNLNNYFASKYKVISPLGMRKILSDEIDKLDIVHIQDLYTIMTYWIYHRVKNTNKSLFISTRGILSPYAQKRFKLIKQILNSIILMKLLKRANYILAQNETELQNIRNLGFSNLQIISNGIDSNKFNNLPSKDTFRKKYNYDSDDIIVLYLGRFNEIKGLNYLIQAFSKIKENDKLKLVLVGPNDNYLNHLKYLINHLNMNGRVKIINGLYGKAKFEVYTAADIFCLPSLYDCCPNSMIEALAAGLPVITTTTNNLCHIIDYSYGRIVEPGNSEDIKRAVLSLKDDIDKIRESSKERRNKIITSYNWDFIVDSLENYYFESLGY